MVALGAGEGPLVAWRNGGVLGGVWARSAELRWEGVATRGVAVLWAMGRLLPVLDGVLNIVPKQSNKRYETIWFRRTIPTRKDNQLQAMPNFLTA